MPHSGGRVGRGIYFASENGKSAGYVGTTNYKSKNIGIMFLNEVALGKEHHITRDDSSLTQPPKGFDSVIARGMTEPGTKTLTSTQTLLSVFWLNLFSINPDPKKNITFEMDGKKVIVPQGKPINQNVSSSFSQSEYLIYDECQNRIRYLLQMEFGY